MRNELQAVHEYEADNGVVTGGANVRDYQLLLIQKAVGSRFPSIANSLDHSNLSKRIKMMLRKKSSPVQRWRAIAAVPALALTAVVFFNPGVAEALESLSTAKVTNYVAIMQEEPAAAAVAEPEQSPIALPSQSGEGDDGVYRSAETMPQYEGGEAALMKFIASNLKWIPGGKNGRLIVQFVVKKDGTVGDVKAVRSLSPEQDAEAERVVRMLKFTPGMMQGKPVNVWYTLPVSFRETKQSNSNTNSNTAPGTTTTTTTTTDGVSTTEVSYSPGN